MKIIYLLIFFTFVMPFIIYFFRPSRACDAKLVHQNQARHLAFFCTASFTNEKAKDSSRHHRSAAHATSKMSETERLLRHIMSMMQSKQTCCAGIIVGGLVVVL